MADELTDAIIKSIRPLIHEMVSNALEGKELNIKSDEKKKKTVDFTKNPVCVLVKDYTDKTHALFGDFRKRYQVFKDETMKNKKEIFKYNAGLQFGPGWLIMKSSSTISNIEKLLKKHEVEFRTIKMEDYMREIFGNSEEIEEEENIKRPPRILKKNSESSEAEKKVKSPPKKATKKKETSEPSSPPTKKKAPPKKASAESEPKGKKGGLNLVKNKWGNMEDKESMLIFKKLPVGDDGKDLLIAIGYQDVDADPNDEDTRGLASVCPLDENLEEVCRKNGWKSIDDEMIAEIGDKNLRKELKQIREKLPADEDSEAEVEELSDEEEEEEDDE